MQGSGRRARADVTMMVGAIAVNEVLPARAHRSVNNAEGIRATSPRSGSRESQTASGSLDDPGLGCRHGATGSGVIVNISSITGRLPRPSGFCRGETALGAMSESRGEARVDPESVVEPGTPHQPDRHGRRGGAARRGSAAVGHHARLHEARRERSTGGRRPAASRQSPAQPLHPHRGR
jgi:hypothetical protein